MLARVGRYFSRSSDSVFDSRLQLRVFEFKTRILEPFGNDFCTREQQCVTHFPKNHRDGKFGKRKECGAIENFAECLCKFLVCDRIWRNGIDGSAQNLISNGKIDDSDLVVERDPTHPLFSAADHATDAEPEGCQHSRESSAIF